MGLDLGAIRSMRMPQHVASQAVPRGHLVYPVPELVLAQVSSERQFPRI